MTYSLLCLNTTVVLLLRSCVDEVTEAEGALAESRLTMMRFFESCSCIRMTFSVPLYFLLRFLLRIDRRWHRFYEYGVIYGVI